MKTLITLSILTLILTVNGRSDDLPKRPEASRYAAMFEHSPFAVATAPVQAPTTPNWSKDLYIANAAHTDEADYVTVVSGSDKSFHETLSTIEPKDGYGIANIQWSDNMGETKATISKDGQYATIGFNQSLLSTSGSAPAPMPPNNPTYMPKPMPPPGNVPTPHVRGVIERNPRNLAPQAPPRGDQ